MKKIFFTCFLAMYILAAFAQDNKDSNKDNKEVKTDKNPKEMQTLFGGGVRFGIFGGPIISFGKMEGALAVFSGGGFAATLNQNLFIGGYWTGMNSTVKVNLPNFSDARMQFKHGGFWLGYHFNPNKVIHLTAASKIGWGDLSFTQISGVNYNNQRNNMFVVEPEFGVELNVARFMKIATTASYRIVSGTTTENYDGSNLNGGAVNVTFKFGWFNSRERGSNKWNWDNNNKNN